MAFLKSAAIANCLLLLTLVLILFLCPPLGVDALPRHRRTVDIVGRITHRSTNGASPVTRSGSLDYVDIWADALEGEDYNEEISGEDYNDQTEEANDEGSSASTEHTSNHHQRRRELNEPLTSRMLREQRSRHRVRKHLAIHALQALQNNLQSRAVCGWTYHNNHDMNRIPVDLPEAVCDSLTVAGTRNRCEQVVYNVPVREIEFSSKGVVSWAAKWLPLRVGCTLATAGTVPYSIS